MDLRTRVIVWALVALALGLALALLGGVLPPFALGAAIAYLLDPTCRRLTALGLPRSLAAALLILGLLALGTGVLLAVVPLLVNQLVQAAQQAPELIDRARLLLNLRLGSEGADELMTRIVEVLRERAGGLSGEALANAWAGGKAVVGLAGMMVVTPVVAFYLLLDWPRVLASVDGLVPVRHRAVVREVAREIDRAMGGLLRGFGTVCLTLGTFYALALTATGLDFGLLIGLFSGAISFIPFVGATVGFLLSMGVAVSQFWAEPVWIAAVAAIFMVGQAVESNILTPRLVGDAVDVHPLWLLFALAAFGAVFGFVGLLVAVPAAAVIGVLVRRGVARYKQSRFYATDGQEGGR